MESNKDEAERCIKIARSSLQSGKMNKALRFATKSMRLYPSSTAKELEEEIKKKISESEHGDGEKKTESTSKKDSPNSSQDFSNLHGSSTETNYTSQQKQLADRINRSKDYYEILGVPKDASDAEIKKAYRKMALQLHPDKNQAPGATEAFKSVGKAFSVLSNAESRQKFDQFGVDGLNPDVNIRRRHDDGRDPFDNEFDAQELFNMFFGGGFPQRNMRVFRHGNSYYYERTNDSRRRHQQHETADGANLNAFVQLVPVLLIFLLSIIGNLMASDPVYNLAQRDGYSYERMTNQLEVKYFVKSGFDDDYPRDTSALRRLEDTIESDYLDRIRNACVQESIEKEQLRRSGIYLGNQDLVKRAAIKKTPSCDRHNELKRKYYRQP